MGATACSAAKKGDDRESLDATGLTGGDVDNEEGVIAQGAATEVSGEKVFKEKTFPDGSVYAGQWVNDIKHGDGTFKYADGDVYEGQFQEGKAHGRGKYASKQSSYEGEWQRDLKHGQANVHG